MSAPPTIIPRDIAQASRDCRQSFTQCLSISGLMREEWAENRLADFNLWAAGVGASAHPLASLDRRLMSQPETYEIVLGLLTMLRVMVDRCVESCPPAPSPSCPPEKLTRIGTHDHSESRVASSSVISSSSEQPSSESPISLTHAMANVDALLDQLISVGFAIRKFGTSARLQKADQSFAPEDYGDLRQHLSLKLLVEQVKRQQKNLVTGEVKDANLRRFIQTLIIVDDTLDEQQRGSIDWEGLNLPLLTAQLSSEQQHLINANLRRRHRFVSARKHGEKLAQGVELYPVEEDPAQPHRPDRPKNTRRADVTGSRPRDPRSMSATSASAGAVPQGALQALPQGPAATVVSTTTQKLALDYPQPPRVVASKGAKGFTCPCCLQTLPIDLAERNQWRKHISEDLAPYTCPFLLCPSPLMLYKTKDAWKSHLFEDHFTAEYWDCIACNKSGKPLCRFDTLEQFDLHTSTEHGDVITSPQLATLRRLSHHKSPPILEACPLCYFRPADVDGKAGANDLLDHISDHIHNFSLESLPWAQDGSRAIRDSPEVDAWLQEIAEVITTDDGEEIHIPTPHDNHVGWLETLRASAETNAEFEEIFDRNGYFNEAGSQKTSNAQLDSDASIAESNTTSADWEGEQEPSGSSHEPGSSLELDEEEVGRLRPRLARLVAWVARDKNFRHISHDIIYVVEEEKSNMLLSTVRRQPDASTFVFTRESERAEEISVFLSAHGHPARTFSGSRHPAVESHRLVVVSDGSDGNAPLLSQAECVISYDCPTSIRQYIYRAGQVDPTSNMKLATTFFNDYDSQIASELVRILEQAGQRIPAFLEAASRSFFVAGRVISVIHHSSMGALSIPSGPYGAIQSSPRRMIIVQPRQGYSVCVPISSHDERGIGNKKLTQTEQQAHAIVYTEGSEVPTPVDGEPKFEKQPIAVRLQGGQTLSKFSRIHFGKYHTVEHNIKVMDVGRVSDESMPDFEAYCRQELLRPEPNVQVDET
ncbi:hypothetical protein PV08_10897 [Exophiala spinifera]|uniref:DUF6590 domain-containing protein n=1 Tax=Exophiala spinifera TaxID=91928 RepID=A0A0D1Y9D5_9EURO|nr:uncharacterized protein PV08_10897 [Exophiala spinifera]KIW11596.1 hypothetical protein PV08_10897 [Exophiala spinifera]